MTSTQSSDFFWLIRVYPQDTDVYGVVFHANYINYMERARTERMRNHGLELSNVMAEGLIFVVAEVNVKYHHPARLDDRLRIRADVASTGRSRIIFHQQVLREETLQPVCTGRVVLACVDASTLKPAKLPQTVADAFRTMVK